MRGTIKQKIPTETANRERYAQQYSRFVETEFTYNTHLLVKKIAELGQKEPYMYGVPLYKIIVEVVKTMLMNELQTLFLASTLQEMKWNITDPCLQDYIEEATDITPRLQKDVQAKKVQFSLLLIAYIVKIYLNEDNSIIDFKIRDIIKNNFDRMYQAWVQRVSSSFKFNPKSMNKVFKEFEAKHKDKNHHIVDYNKLVSNFFKENDNNYLVAEPEEEPKTYTMQYPQNYQARYHNREQERPSYLDSSRSRDNRRNQIFELPVQEQPSPQIPEQNNRRQSIRLNRLNSEIGFTRQESGNEFFVAQPSERSGLFRLGMRRSSSRASQNNDF